MRAEGETDDVTARPMWPFYTAGTISNLIALLDTAWMGVEYPLR